MVSARTGIGFIFICLLNTSGLYVCAQSSPFDSALTEEAALIQENVSCFTDRSLYITDEQISFRANIDCKGLTNNRSWSKVLYVELISAHGKAEVYGKFPIMDQVSTGAIHIPRGIPSGIYALRSYTRWMRNRGPETYCYIPLKIINPYSAELVRENPTGKNPVRMHPVSKKPEAFELKAHPTHCERGELVNITLSFDGNSAHNDLEGCLTVVALAAKPGMQTLTEERAIDDPAGAIQLNYLPDLHGPSLSGTVLDSGEEEKPARDVRIHITLLGEEGGYLVTRTDVHGRFALTLPARQGKQELFIQPESPDTGKPEVRVDQDFDQRQILLRTGPFELSGEERQVATAMARKVELSSIFTERDARELSGSEPEAFPFYGEPGQRILLEDYILLPSLKEVFINLVHNVLIVSRKNKTSLLIRSENPAISLYEPLILIDQVPFFNMEKLMTVSPAKIRLIDVVDDVYVKGDQSFGGIISLQSKEMDMAGVELPANSFFIDFDGMYPSPETRKQIGSPGDKLPDTRNTLLWIPGFKLGKDAPGEVSLIAPDYPGAYVVLFRGMDPHGKYFSTESVFDVK